MTYGVLPALVRGPVVGVVLGDIGIDPGQGELLLRSLGDRLYDQLGVRERWLALICLRWRVKISSVRRRKLNARALVVIVLYGGRGIHWDCGETSVLSGVDHSVVSQQVEVRLGLLQLHLGDGGGVLGDGSVVGVGVEDAVGVGAGGAGVGHTDGPSGGGGGAGLVVGVITAGDADGQRSHPALSIASLLSGRRHQR